MVFVNYDMPCLIRKVCLSVNTRGEVPTVWCRFASHHVACLGCFVPQSADGEWSVQWDTENYLARSTHSIADEMPALWVGVITSKCFLGGVFPPDLTASDKATISTLMKEQAVRNFRRCIAMWDCGTAASRSFPVVVVVVLP